jgi:hypothetical protein
MLTSFSPVVAAVIDDGTFGSAYLEGHPLARMSIGEPLITDGVIANSLRTIAPGQDVVISAMVKNAQRVEQSFIFIVEVFSPTGHVESIMMDSASLEQGETSNIYAAWNSDDNQAAGKYEIKILVLSDFDDAFVLAEVTSIELDVSVNLQT